jgi:hypothetical protein
VSSVPFLWVRRLWKSDDAELFVRSGSVYASPPSSSQSARCVRRGKEERVSSVLLGYQICWSASFLAVIQYREIYPGSIPIKVDLKMLERRELFPNLLQCGLVEVRLATNVASATQFEVLQ